MKTKLMIIATAVLLSSCKKDKEPIACIDGPTSLAEGQTGSYTWCGTDGEEITWTSVAPDKTTKSIVIGENFSPTFLQRGLYTITVEAKNGSKKAEKSIQVEYGKTSEIICRIVNLCYSGSTNIGNMWEIEHLKAYLFRTRTDWVTSTKNGNRNLAIDSVTCEYSPKYNTAIARFKKSYPQSSSAVISVEYIDVEQPNNFSSNWYRLMDNNATGVELSGLDYTTSVFETSLFSLPKKFLVKKWKIQSMKVNGQSNAIADCNKDDRLRFFADGTWTYDVGANDCGGLSLPSNGTFGTTSLPACEASTLIFQTKNGPFVPTSVSYYDYELTTQSGVLELRFIAE